MVYLELPNIIVQAEPEERIDNVDITTRRRNTAETRDVSKVIAAPHGLVCYKKR